MPDTFPGKQRRWIEGDLERVGKLGLRLGLMAIKGQMDKFINPGFKVYLLIVRGSLFSYILPQELDKPIGIQRAMESDD